MSDAFTVIGARGFIGAALEQSLRGLGCDVAARRSDESPLRDRGHVIYASGVAWDAKQRPIDAYELHVERVRRTLAGARPDSFTYLSSSRVYDGAARTDEEAPLSVRPDDASATYKNSKIAGESLCLGIDDPRIRVIRLSNVFGPSVRSELFLSQLLRAAVRERVVRVRTSPASAKDYVSIDDVVRLIPEIARRGRERVYNVARGENTTNATILEAIVRASSAAIEIAPDAETIVTSPISIARLAAEFPVPQLRVEDAIPALVRRFAEAELAPAPP